MNIFKKIGDWIVRFFSDESGELRKEIEKLKQELENKKNPKEEFYNTKYPTANIEYRREETDGTYWIDVRTFFNEYDYLISKIEGTDDNDIALKCLKWIVGNIEYTSDKKQYNYNEYWAYPYQTLKRKKGDCEDGSILLANIMLKSGIPYWKIRITAGDTPMGGHAYVTYYDEPRNRWVSLDWCYFPSNKAIKDRIDYKEDKLYGNIWFSFNQKFAFAKGTKTETSQKLYRRN